MATTSPEKPAGLRRWAVPAAVAVAIAAALVIVLLVTRGGPPPPATGTASLVPGDALLYVHLSTDPKRPEVRQARRLAARFPDYQSLAGAVTGRLSTMLGGGVPLDVARQIRPWLGAEAAFAVLNSPGANAGSLIVLRAAHAGPLFDTGAVPNGSYRGDRLYRTAAGTELAFIGHYLVIGQDASVRAAIDVGRGRVRSLASAPAYRAAAAGEPAGRVLDAYVSQAGVQRVLAPRGGLAGALAVLLGRPGFRGATVSVSPASRGVSILVHSALTRDASRAAPVSFTPTLGRATPPGTPLLLDVGDLAQAAPTVLGATAQLGLVSGLGPLLARLGAALSAEGVDVGRALSLFSHEGAVIVSPSPSGGTPALTVLARAPAPDTARVALAALEAPLAQVFTPVGSLAGQVPEWSDQRAGSVPTRQFAFSPGLQLDYAVFDGLVVVSTSTSAIAEIARGGRGLAASLAFRRAFPNRPAKVTSLLFFDLRQLLSLGEQTGLVDSPRLRRLGPDLEQIRAVGASSTSGEADTTAELFLETS
jgi:hypothetical protein